MKGIILAGGQGTRLYPSTLAVSKQILPVYDKPMIYYPLCLLMLAGIRDVLVISSPRDLPQFKSLLGDGAGLGISLHYAEQAAPRGIAEAFLIGRGFIGRDPVALILGDNIFLGRNIGLMCREAATNPRGATIFVTRVKEPSRFGIASFEISENGEGDRVLAIEEKPENPASDWAVSGLYFYDNDVVRIAEELQPSRRGELEITDINQAYLAQGNLTARRLGDDCTWIDAGTHESLHDAACLIRRLEQEQGFKVMCPEEVALQCGYVSASDVVADARKLGAIHYAEYLCRQARAWEVLHG